MNRLRELRENKDLYKKDIAKYLNMSQTGYSQYETEIKLKNHNKSCSKSQIIKAETFCAKQ